MEYQAVMITRTGGLGCVYPLGLYGGATINFMATIMMAAAWSNPGCPLSLIISYQPSNICLGLSLSQSHIFGHYYYFPSSSLFQPQPTLNIELSF